jgi:TRAP-type C4-dicarboxylate transport system permease small subunit
MRLIDSVKSFLNKRPWIKKYLSIILIVVLLAATILVISIVADLINCELSESSSSGGFICDKLNVAIFTTILIAFITVPIAVVFIIVYILQDLIKLFRKTRSSQATPGSKPRL